MQTNTIHFQQTVNLSLEGAHCHLTTGLSCREVGTHARHQGRYLLQLLLGVVCSLSNVAVAQEGRERVAKSEAPRKDIQGQAGQAEIRSGTVPLRATAASPRLGATSSNVVPRAEAVTPDTPARDASTDVITPPPNTMAGLNDKRPLTIGDRLSFSIVEDEAQPVGLVVTDSGEIVVPYIGRVAVARMTCKQLAQHLKKILEKEYYYHATVLIGLDTAGRGASSRGKVFVMGQVRSVGAQDIPIDEVFTVSKAILRAGGFLPYADKRKVKVIRGGNAGAEAETIIVDLVKILEQGRRQHDIEVGPDDLITVPEKWLNF